jgi:hypothetical protein
VITLTLTEDDAVAVATTLEDVATQRRDRAERQRQRNLLHAISAAEACELDRIAVLVRTAIADHYLHQQQVLDGARMGGGAS